MINKTFNPKNIAVVGATDRKMSVGRGVIENMKKAGQKNTFYINPNKEKVLGKKTYKKLTDVKEKIDLVVIIVPQKFVDNVVDDCISKRVKTVIIISSGFREVNEEGRILEKRISEKLEKNNIRLVGPNTLGIIRPPKKLNLSFAPSNPKKGDMAFIFQSGGFIDALIEGKEKEEYGFSFVVSVGNEAGLTFADYIRMANEDQHTNSIGLYVEGLTDGQEFYSALKQATKPVVVLKAGKEERSKKAISSHTGSLAGEHRIFSAAVKQAGAFSVDSLEELFNTVKGTAWLSPIKNRNVAIVTNGGGAGVLLADYFAKHNIKLPAIKPSSQAEKTAPFAFHNPLDVLGDALPDRYLLGCETALKQKNISALVVVQTPQIMTDPVGNAKLIVQLKNKYRKPILTVFMGQGEKTVKAIKILEKNRIPNYDDPQKIIKPLLAIIK